MKRMLAVSQYPRGSTVAVPNVTAPTTLQASMTNIGAYDDREIYRPVTDATFATNQITITAENGVVTEVAAGTARFLSGMPQASNPIGGPVLPGDLLVVNGVAYEIVANAG